MPFFRKPKLTKQEKEQIKKAERTAYFKRKLELAKRKGKHKATPKSKTNMAKNIAKYVSKIAKHARKIDKDLEKEF